MFGFDHVVGYIDPGTGQAVLYALAAVGTGILFQFRRLKNWFTGRFRRGAERGQ